MMTVAAKCIQDEYFVICRRLTHAGSREVIRIIIMYTIIRTEYLWVDNNEWCTRIVQLLQFFFF